MYARRDEKAIDPSLSLHRHSHVGMLKQGREQRGRLPHGERKRGDAKEQNLPRPPSDREDQFAAIVLPLLLSCIGMACGIT